MFTHTPSPLRKTVCRLFFGIFLGLFPRIKHLCVKSLFHVSIWHMGKVYYQYKFKQPKQYKYFLSVVMCVKDEGAYLKEWIEYYLLQGVEHFYIYNNNGTDNSLDLIQKYIDKDLVTWIDFPGPSMQRTIYNNAIERFKNETKWLAIIDCDEFIVPLSPVKISDWLKSFSSYSQVLIYWCLYGSSGHKKKVPGLVIERFTQHQKDISSTPKAIVNPRAVIYAGVHEHIVFGDTVNENKEILYGWKDPKPTGSTIRINHYAIKSYEEFKQKQLRGDACDEKRSYKDDYFKHCDINEIDEPHLMERYIQLIKEKLAA